MKHISSSLLALVFVFFTLLSLLSVNPTWENGPLVLPDNGARVSEIGLRVTFQR